MILSSPQLKRSTRCFEDEQEVPTWTAGQNKADFDKSLFDAALRQAWDGWYADEGESKPWPRAIARDRPEIMQDRRLPASSGARAVRVTNTILRPAIRRKHRSPRVGSKRHRRELSADSANYGSASCRSETSGADSMSGAEVCADEAAEAVSRSSAFNRVQQPSKRLPTSNSVTAERSGYASSDSEPLMSKVQHAVPHPPLRATAPASGAGKAAEAAPAVPNELAFMPGGLFTAGDLAVLGADLADIRAILSRKARPAYERALRSNLMVFFEDGVRKWCRAAAKEDGWPFGQSEDDIYKAIITRLDMQPLSKY